jgi:hypothetical protein
MRFQLPGVRRPFLAGSAVVFFLLSPAGSGAEADAGALAGTVSNTATGNLLQGARVEVRALNLTTFSDNTGRYVLGGLPAGTHEVVVSYTGLDTQRRSVAVTPGQRVSQDFDLTTGIY